jgi:argonaute-like protein implicated in RNA metabolism and viral defense
VGCQSFDVSITFDRTFSEADDEVVLRFVTGMILHSSNEVCSNEICSNEVCMYDNCQK